MSSSCKACSPKAGTMGYRLSVFIAWRFIFCHPWQPKLKMRICLNFNVLYLFIFLVFGGTFAIISDERLPTDHKLILAAILPNEYESKFNNIEEVSNKIFDKLYRWHVIRGENIFKIFYFMTGLSGECRLKSIGNFPRSFPGRFDFLTQKRLKGKSPVVCP